MFFRAGGAQAADGPTSSRPSASQAGRRGLELGQGCRGVFVRSLQQPGGEVV
jgi:hypothetical protein